MKTITVRKNDLIKVIAGAITNNENESGFVSITGDVFYNNDRNKGEKLINVLNFISEEYRSELISSEFDFDDSEFADSEFEKSDLYIEKQSESFADYIITELPGDIDLWLLSEIETEEDQDGKSQKLKVIYI